MLPSTGEVLRTEFQIREKPWKTFSLQKESKRIGPMIDGRAAMEQAIYCILETERYDWLIYSWNYGMERKDLYGKPMPYVKARLERRVTEALLQDDRIQQVDQFEAEDRGKALYLTFRVGTTQGDFRIGKEIAYHV